MKQKLGNPIFIASVLMLLANDWLFKTAFHNTFTGKLSDFAGLLAFPFFVSLFFPHHKKVIHYLTALLFVFWKSEWSQPLIELVNSLGVPIYRTVDLTDCIALISIYFSYRLLEKNWQIKLQPRVASIWIGITCIAFIATSQVPHEYRKYVAVNKEYQFEFSKRKLVSMFNMVQMKEVNRLNKHSGAVAFNSETNTFHYHQSTDTLALILDENKLLEGDTIRFKTSYAEILITGNNTQSKMKLLSIYQFCLLHKEKNDYRKLAIKGFENRIIKRIRKFHKKTESVYNQ